MDISFLTVADIWIMSNFSIQLGKKNQNIDISTELTIAQDNYTAVQALPEDCRFRSRGIPRKK